MAKKMPYEKVVLLWQKSSMRTKFHYETGNSTMRRKFYYGENSIMRRTF